MKEQRIERYLHEHIPLSAHMGVRVVSASQTGVRLSAPLLPNINHRGTVFGGSASALAILAGWTLVHARLQEHGFEGRIVIRRNTMEYDKPITGAFEAFCAAPQQELWQRFVEALDRSRKARMELTVELEQSGTRVGLLTGVYVAIMLPQEAS